MPKLQIPRKLIPLVQKKKRYKIIIGGRGSSKSTTVTDICLMDGQVSGLKTGCFREFQNSIEDSVYSLIEDRIDKLNLEGWVCQGNVIFNPSSDASFKFRGLARNIGSVKSMHGFDRFFIEEAQFLSEASIKLLTPTLREADSEIWMVANPMSKADPFSQRFIVPFEKELLKNGYYEDEMHLIIVCNYTDNPFFPDVLEQERLYDERTLSKAEYEHIWLGKFNDTVPGAIISIEMFDAAIDAHIKLGFEPSGIKVVSHDPSDTGPDPKGLVYRHGSVLLDVQENKTGDVNEGADWALNYAIDVKADAFIWDGDGMGVGLRKQVSDALTGKTIVPHMFRGSEGVDEPAALYMPVEPGKRDIDGKTNKDTFTNKRAQYYWYLRDKFYNTWLAIEQKQYINPDDIISISSEIALIEQLRTEVCRIPRKTSNASGKIQILSKEEMKKKPYEIPSPNLSDSLMMSQDVARINQNAAQAVNIEFDSLWS